MENVMTNGFENFNADELENVDGGVEWGAALGGAALVIACVAFAATCPVAAAGIAGGFAIDAAGLGGYAVGWGLTH